MVGKRILRRFPRLQAAYRAYRASKHLPWQPVKTPLGFLLVGNTAMQSGAFEPVETEIFQRLLQDVDVVVNIGANIGYYCCIALSQQKHVIAFEPMPRNLEFLMRNVQINEWSKSIEIFPLALSENVGIAEIFGEGTGASLVKGWAGQSEAPTLVPMSTLDVVLGDRLKQTKCLVLVDIEGAELAMLKGATQLLENSPKPTWMVEVSIHEHQPEGVDINPNLIETFRMFHDAGYSAYTADSEDRRISADEVAKVAETGNDTLKTHNFVFRSA